MKKLLSLLNSRRFAVYLLAAVVALLVASTFLPSEITRTPEQWALMARREPLWFRICSAFSTPYLVKQWGFQVTASFLFLSTLTCTCSRLYGWWRGRESEFSKEKAFSFYREGDVPEPESVAERAVGLLKAGRWKCDTSRQESLLLTAEKGLALGLWGSLVFHAGLLICFLAIPLSYFYSFSGNLVLTEGALVDLRASVRPEPGGDPAQLPSGRVSVSELRGVYAQGRFKRDFGGVLLLESGGRRERLPFRVNGPASSGGFQFSLQEYGFSPRVVVEGGAPFDYFLNLTHPDQGDWFPLAPDTRLFVLLFPDFIREGDRIGSRSREPRNPRLLVRIYRGEKPVFERLVRVGEKVEGDGFAVAAPELRSWASLAVSREPGLILVILGSLVVTLGLLARFLSNERRLELEVFPAGPNGTIRLKGYSRYYPAFLEKEVTRIFDKLRERA